LNLLCIIVDIVILRRGENDFTSSSFWKGSLPPYRERQNESSEPSESPSSIHSLEDDEVEAQVGGEMVISTSLANLNI
jgi:hypothetical protein